MLEKRAGIVLCGMEHFMSQWDIKWLETNFEGFRRDRYPSHPASQAFERFTIRQILKDTDLSDDEIESGIVAGGDDGGIDGIYFFVNRALVQDETDLPEEALSAELVIFQAKLEAGFSEDAVIKLEAFTRDLLDHSRDVDGMVHLNSDAREGIRRFRRCYTAILGSQHSMKVTYAYATKSDQPPNQKVNIRVNALRCYVQQQLSDAKFSFEFWGAQQLLTAARRAPKTQQTLQISKQFTADDGSAVCLVKLGSLATLLRDEHGEIRRSMLEPNVRDYQGVRNPVNKAIRQTLASSTPTSEFWWLNNGVTIIASKCSVVGNKIVIEKPEVVNGLQTTYEIFQFFKDKPTMDDARNVLVRVIVPPDEQIRSAIIRATNSQTPIPEVSLRATDPIHFDIEEKFRLYQLYYERRKGEYRELKKPADQIISIQTLARAVIAMLLRQPNNAYATPARVLKADYDKIFCVDYSRDMFVVCMLVQRCVDRYLASRDELRAERSIIRYYVSMTATCLMLNKASEPTDKELAAALPAAVKGLDKRMLDDSASVVTAAYQQHGGTETIAKGPEMRQTILTNLASRFVPVEARGQER